eukprot:7160917-Alexandrium_andersonii.AAC.1
MAGSPWMRRRSATKRPNKLSGGGGMPARARLMSSRSCQENPLLSEPVDDGRALHAEHLRREGDRIERVHTDAHATLGD